jgi:hypothetical protein
MSESGSKTEKATPRRREEARKDGQVARSEDLSHLILFGFFFSYLIIDGARLGAELTGLILLPYAYLGDPFPTAAKTLTALILTKALSLIFVILIASVAFSFLIQLIQIGPLFSSKSITPSLKKLNAIPDDKSIACCVRREDSSPSSAGLYPFPVQDAKAVQPLLIGNLSEKRGIADAARPEEVPLWLEHRLQHQLSEAAAMLAERTAIDGTASVASNDDVQKCIGDFIALSAHLSQAKFTGSDDLSNAMLFKEGRVMFPSDHSVAVHGGVLYIEGYNHFCDQKAALRETRVKPPP